jgi:SAM-dependent methyltransferase
LITIDFDRLGLAPGLRVLDLGCGTGRHVCEAARTPNVLAVGADLKVDDLREAGRRVEVHKTLGEHGGGAEGFLAADALHLPFADAAFDRVVCSEVMEHIDNDRAAAGELYRVLKPGGRLAVSVPRRWPERVCWALSREYTGAAGGHVRIYREKALIRVMEATGLAFEGRHYAHGLHAPYWWLKCLVGPSRDIAPVRWCHDFLVWDMMKKPRLTRTLDRLLTPVAGKSAVFYFHKP